MIRKGSFGVVCSLFRNADFSFYWYSPAYTNSNVCLIVNHNLLANTLVEQKYDQE